jgi:hypothetical protein
MDSLMNQSKITTPNASSIRCWASYKRGSSTAIRPGTARSRGGSDRFATPSTAWDLRDPHHPEQK